MNSPLELTPMLTIHMLAELKPGFKVKASDVSHLSGQNRIKGIHPIGSNDVTGVIILCTIGSGGEYPNKWLDSSHTRLKYYMEGREDKQLGRKKYFPHWKSNQAVMNAKRDSYPVYVFVRERQGDAYQYQGQFFCEQVVDKEWDSYFILANKDAYEEQSKKQHIEQIWEETPYYDIDEADIRVNEGKKVLRIHMQRERASSKLKKEAIRRVKMKGQPVSCEVCGFVFEEVYGKHGADYIEAHHKVPLSELEAEGAEVRVEDIALLCSNCHSMIHRKREWLTVEELKKIVQSQRATK
ncbi:hypothetical protein GIJ05_11515 [Laceyella tengchongensis]|nr:hypothetical protein [Laceyella tengchongensis]